MRYQNSLHIVTLNCAVCLFGPGMLERVLLEANGVRHHSICFLFVHFSLSSYTSYDFSTPSEIHPLSDSTWSTVADRPNHAVNAGDVISRCTTIISWPVINYWRNLQDALSVRVLGRRVPDIRMRRGLLICNETNTASLKASECNDALNHVSSPGPVSTSSKRWLQQSGQLRALWRPLPRAKLRWCA